MNQLATRKAKLVLLVSVLVVIAVSGVVGYRVWRNLPGTPVTSVREQQAKREKYLREKEQAQEDHVRTVAEEEARVDKEAWQRELARPPEVSSIWPSPDMIPAEDVEEAADMLPSLLQDLEAKDANQRIRAMAFLTAIGRERGKDFIAKAKPKYMEMLADPDGGVRAAAVAGLSNFPGTLTKQQLEQLGQDPGYVVSRSLRTYLENSGTDRDIAYLAEIVRSGGSKSVVDGEETVEITVLQAMGSLIRIGSRAKKTVMEVLAECDLKTQRSVIRKMSKKEDTLWNEAFIEIARNDSLAPETRIKAAIALSTVDPQCSYQLFAEIADSGGEQVREEAQREMHGLELEYGRELQPGADF